MGFDGGVTALIFVTEFMSCFVGLLAGGCMLIGLGCRLFFVTWLALHLPVDCFVVVLVIYELFVYCGCWYVTVFVCCLCCWFDGFLLLAFVLFGIAPLLA